MTKAEQHWDYVRRVLEVHGEDDRTIAIIGHHYIEAFNHGYKHGMQDERKEEVQKGWECGDSITPSYFGVVDIS